MRRSFWIAGALAAFLAAGPLQHVGAIPQTPVGEASKATLKAVLNLGAKEALACTFPGTGGGNGHGGWGGWNWSNTHLGEIINRWRDWLRSRRS